MARAIARALLIAAAAASTAVGKTFAGTDESVVVTPLGILQGIVNPIAREFRGVPFATPPVGALRWKSPLPAVPWNGTRDATADGPGCIQHCGEPAPACPATISEDCLQLNVFTPRLADVTAPLPVLVFWHGGNFRDGFEGGPLYNGSELAANERLVVISATYRLGLLGFLAANVSDAGASVSTSPDDITGNYGLQDQRQALRWVQDNIAAFGGDPTRVTISGQSAGAMSVASHLISPASQGLFTAAVMLSEPFALPFRNVPQALEIAAAVLDLANCSVAAGMRGFGTPAACMRSLSVDTLVAVQIAAMSDIAADLSELLQVFMPFPPTYGPGLDVPNWPLYSFQGRPGAAPVADVPIMAGTTSQEGVLFIFSGFKGNMSTTLYDLLLPVTFGLDAGAAIGQQYPVPAPAPADLRPLASNVTTAGIFKCPTRNATAMLSALPGRTAPVFTYEYSHLLSFSPAVWLNTSTCCWDAVCHGEDLPEWWYPQDAALGTNWTQPERALAASMQGYLGSFAYTGNPGSGRAGTPVPWPAVNASAGLLPRMQLDVPAPVVLQDPAAAECAVFDRFGYAWY